MVDTVKYFGTGPEGFEEVTEQIHNESGVPAEGIIALQNIKEAADKAKELANELRNPFDNDTFLKSLANIYVALEKLIMKDYKLNALVEEIRAKEQQTYEETSQLE